LTDDNRDKLTYIAGKYNQIVKFYNVEVLCKERIAEFHNMFSTIEKGRWTLASYYPFFISDIVDKDVKKIIYLDTDTIVNLDISKLWKVELENKMLAVVPDTWRENLKRYIERLDLCALKLVKIENRFNSGVYVLNVEKFASNIQKFNVDIKYFIENFNVRMAHDEVLLNYSFSEDTVKLPLKFNDLVPFARKQGSYNVDDVIAHYFQRSVGIDFNDHWTALWFKYFMKTPWFNEKMLANMFGETLKIYNEQRDRMVWLANLLSSRRRAFCVSANYADVVKKNFEIKDGEDFIAVEPGDAEEKFVELVNQARNKSSYSLVDKSDGKGFSFVEGERKVFIIFNQNYGKFKNALVKEGLKEWQDFFNGHILLSQKNGIPFDSWRIVRNM